MKIYGVLCIIVGIMMLVCPLASIPYNGNKSSDTEKMTEIETNNTSKTSDDTISVFMSNENQIEEMDMRQYIIGTVAAEMPASYNSEALKAQALAAITFAEYQKINNNDSLNGADISDNSNTHQGYMSKSEMQEKWGDTYETYYEKIADAVDEVIDEVIVYNGKPIIAAYHAISTGKTESAENVWGKSVPYLISVNSEGDKYSSRYSSTVTFTENELKEAVKSKVKNPTENEDGIIINETTDSGTVSSVTVFGEKLTGMELRNLLSLRSPSFDVSYKNGEYLFTVKGYGHGVGMSQYGADWYAKQGYTYKEIISHYYPETTIEQR